MITAREFVDLCLSKNIKDFLDCFGDLIKETDGWYDLADEYLFVEGHEVSEHDLAKYRLDNDNKKNKEQSSSKVP